MKFIVYSISGAKPDIDDLTEYKGNLKFERRGKPIQAWEMRIGSIKELLRICEKIGTVEIDTDPPTLRIVDTWQE